MKVIFKHQNLYLQTWHLTSLPACLPAEKRKHWQSINTRNKVVKQHGPQSLQFEHVTIFHIFMVCILVKGKKVNFIPEEATKAQKGVDV